MQSGVADAVSSQAMLQRLGDGLRNLYELDPISNKLQKLVSAYCAIVGRAGLSPPTGGKP
jgi:hypothetical protein